jgi:hypothetical protein
MVVWKQQRSKAKSECHLKLESLKIWIVLAFLQ